LPRYQLIFGKTYPFAGQVNCAEEETPPVITEFLAWANTTPYASDGFTFNGVVMNIYRNGHQYIGAHSDSENGLVVTEEGETMILGANFGSTRTLRFRPKRAGGVKLDLVLKAATGYVMGGRTQRTHTHEIVKVSGRKGEAIPPRISLTARCFVGPGQKRRRMERGSDE
jgi:alkylated DNA repair dioxygenase AlkB